MAPFVGFPCLGLRISSFRCSVDDGDCVVTCFCGVLITCQALCYLCTLLNSLNCPVKEVLLLSISVLQILGFRVQKVNLLKGT